MTKHDDSGLFTLAPPIPGQTVIPLGTAHICTCGNSHVCDLPDCDLPQHIAEPSCGGPDSHLEGSDVRREALAEIRVAREEAERIHMLRTQGHYHLCNHRGCSRSNACTDSLNCPDVDAELDCGGFHQLQLF